MGNNSKQRAMWMAGGIGRFELVWLGRWLDWTCPIFCDMSNLRLYVQFRRAVAGAIEWDMVGAIAAEACNEGFDFRDDACVIKCDQVLSSVVVFR